MQSHVDSNSEEIIQFLGKVDKELNNSDILLDTIGNALENEIHNSFETHSTPDGKPWSPIKSTSVRKYNQDRSKILEDQGTLSGSIYHQVEGDTVTIGVNAVANGFEYGLSHQWGSESRNIEQREFMPIHEDGTLYSDTEQMIVDVLEEWADNVLK